MVVEKSVVATKLKAKREGEEVGKEPATKGEEGTTQKHQRETTTMVK